MAIKAETKKEERVNKLLLALDSEKAKTKQLIKKTKSLENKLLRSKRKNSELKKELRSEQKKN
jgi:hypothetical protein